MQSASGTIQRAVAFHFEPGEDIFTGLQEVCRREGIASGVVLCCMGSLREVSFCAPEPIPTAKAGFGYGETFHRTDGPFELLSVSGLIGPGADGKTLQHLHYVFGDRHGVCTGGHMVEGNRVLMTVEGVLGVLEEVSLNRRWDDTQDVFVLDPQRN